jgi:hypothetical protein
MLCAAYGYTDDERGQRLARFGGTAVFVAPLIALTAAHVAQDHYRVDPHYDIKHFDRWKARSNYFYPPNSVGLLQIPDPDDQGVVERAASWLVNRVWQSAFTDLAVMCAVPDEGPTTAKQMALAVSYFEWSLLPPPVGSQVVMLGFPNSDVSSIADRTNFRAQYVLQSGEVVEVFERMRDAGMYSFPCFSIDQAVEGGFSGGAVFWEGRLCGIVSGDSFGHTYAATLWPLCLMECHYPDIAGPLGASHTFGAWFDNGMLRSPDWKAVKERIAIELDDRGQPRPILRPA